jgi:hypothetical protein
MAYIVDSKVQLEDEIDIVTISDYPEHQADDYLFLFAVKAIGGDLGFTTTPAGWVELENDGTNGSGFGLWYKKCTSNNEAPITVGRSGDIDESAFQILSIRGADLTNPIDAFVNDVSEHIYAGVDIHGAIPPSVTTTKDNQLILIGLTGNDGDCVYLDQPLGSAIEVMNVISGVSANMGAYSKIGGSAGVQTFTETIYSDLDDIMVWTLAINSAESGGSTAIDSSTTNEDLSPMGLWDKFQGIGSATALNGIMPTYDGKTVNATTITSVDGGIYHLEINSNTRFSLSLTYSADTIDGFAYVMDSAKDLSDGVITLQFAHFSYSAQPIADIVFIDSSGNWASFDLLVNKNASKSGTAQRYIGKPYSDTPKFSSGTIDWTDINRFGIVLESNRSGTGSRTIYLGELMKLKTTSFTGGNSDVPLTPRLISKSVFGEGQKRLASSQGVGQDAFNYGIQLGNGSRTTYYSQQTSSMEWVLPSSSQYYHFEQSDFPLYVNASANDTYDFRASITATKGGVPFSISGSNLATFLFNGWNGIGLDITWLSGVTANSASFINCSIDGKGGIFNNCSFSDGAGSLVLSSGGKATNSSFTKGNETYAVEITEAGTYDFGGSTFDGYTTVFNITASSGAVNILGVNEAYVSSGATVNFISGADLSFTGLQTNTEVRVYLGTDPSTATEIGGQEDVTTGTFSMTHSNAGQDGYAMIHSVGYNSIYLPITFSASDTSIPIQQQFDRNYRND